MRKFFERFTRRSGAQGWAIVLPCSAGKTCYEKGMKPISFKFHAAWLFALMMVAGTAFAGDQSTVDHYVQVAQSTAEKTKDKAKDTAAKVEDAVKDAAQKAVDAGEKGVQKASKFATNVAAKTSVIATNVAAKTKEDARKV